MARIPDDEIERLKAEVSVLALVQAKGIALARHGADWLGRCPFHEDKTPSLVISPAKNLWHCLGACHTGGSVIDWVMRERGVAFRRAVELVRAEVGAVSVADSRAAVPPRAAAKIVAPLAAGVDDAALLDEVIGFYHATLKASPEALAYLAQRGLTHPDVIDHFRLGFANRTLAYRLPHKQIKSGAAVRGQLQRLGLVRTSGHEHFNGSLIVPVVDAMGVVVEVYGRKLRDDLREGTPKHLYLPGPHRGVFNLADWQGGEEVILCEALLDALTFWCAGYRHVTSAYGVNGFTDELLQAFVVHGVKRVLIAYDHDAAGDAAAADLVPRVNEHGIDAFRVRFPHGLDANAYALQVTPAVKSLGLVLRQAEWLGKGRTAPAITTRAPLAVTEVLPLVAKAAAKEETDDSEAVSAAPAPDASDEVTDPACPEVPIASPLPSAAPALPVTISDHELALTLGDRTYVVRGIEKNLSYEQLKVWIKVGRADFVHVDTVELYAAKQRQAWLKAASVELGLAEDVLKTDLGKLLRVVEQRQDALIRAKLAPAMCGADAALALPPEQRDAALALLRDPELARRIVADVEAIGVVGEDANALVGYLACVSRQLDRPLAILIQSTSAAGKSTLMDGLLSLMPEAERVHYSAMTGQSLFYLGEGDLKHKILSVAEEEGVRQAAYALKLLQSQGELTIASTGKDPTTGKLVTEEYRVEGPVMLFLTTTAIEIDEELLNRCLVLTINESREQTEAIHRRQREARTLSGLLATKQAAAIRALHQAAQQLLRPLAVVNPYAEHLTFRSESTRMRRDHAKYLTLIDAIAFLHQHQRPMKTAAVGGESITYVEVTLDDIALANRLANDVLGRSLDELPPQTRRVLTLLEAFVVARCREQAIERTALRFIRREVRSITGLSDTQLRVHLDRLVQLDYVLAHAGRNGQRFVYELVFDGAAESAAPQLIGLRDVETLRAPSPSSRGVEATSRGEGDDLAPRLRAARGEVAAGLRSDQTPRSASTDAGSSSLVAAVEETARPRSLGKQRSTRSNGAVPAPATSA